MRPGLSTRDQSDGGNASPYWSHNRRREIPAGPARKAKPLRNLAGMTGTIPQSPLPSMMHRERCLQDRTVLQGPTVHEVVHWLASSRILSTCVQAGEALPLQTSRDACE